MKTSDWWLNAMPFAPAAAFLVGLAIEAVLNRHKRIGTYKMTELEIAYQKVAVKLQRPGMNFTIEGLQYQLATPTIISWVFVIWLNFVKFRFMGSSPEEVLGMLAQTLDNNLEGLKSEESRGVVNVIRS